jgi:hypothetical protein
LCVACAPVSPWATLHVRTVSKKNQAARPPKKSITATTSTIRHLHSAQGPHDLSGTWSFTHFDDHFQGWITLRQSGSALEGTWHTSSGKSEPDTVVTGSVDGAAVTLVRSLGSNQQSYTMTLSSDGNRLDGFGEGYFLHHTNLNMTRSETAKPATAPPSTTR